MKKVEKKPSNRVVFATTYHPALPSYSSMLTKAWKVMTKDNYMKEVFSKPLVAYRQPRNSSLRSLLVKTRLPQDRRASRTKAGMRRCNNNNCNCCPFVLETDKVTSAASKFSVKLLEPVNCETKNVVYCLSCTKPACKGIQYIGETHRKFQKRFSEHVGYVKNNILTQPTGAHFNLPGHSIADMKGTIIEKCKRKSDAHRKQRESHFINEFDTFRYGLNKRS